MSTVTQRIPNLFLGISQQNDSRKIPGQVRDVINGFPDYALGMLKRPGGAHISSLVNASTEGRWFSILRDANEKYVAQYDDNQFRIWNLIDGDPVVVDMGANTGVQAACSVADTRTALDTYVTAKALTVTRLEELNAAQSTYAETLAGQSGTEAELFDIRYNYESSTGVVFDKYMISGITLDADGVYTVKNADTQVSQSSTLPTGYRRGREYTDEHPSLAADGYRVFSAIRTLAATHTATQLTTAETAMNTAQTNYDNAETAEGTALTNYNNELADCEITDANQPANAYLAGAEPEDIELLTLNDYTFVLNKNRTVAWTANTTAALENEALVVISIVANNVDYKVILDGTTYTQNSGSSANADSIATGLRNQINGNNGFTATVVGPAIHITKSNAFTLETRGATQDGGLYGFQSEVNTVSALPSQAHNGYKVRVVNSQEIDVDDMWLEFFTTSGGNYGVGTWEESVGPGIEFELDPLTLPHRLVRTANGNFEYRPIDWDDRVIGDNTTNPAPSFVGQTISNIFLYRNRLGFISNESVVMSRAGDLFNFFNTTALTAVDDDPIDIAVSTAKPVTLNYVQPTSVGLILFGGNEQFLLSTDSDILSPKSTKINTLSSYECDQNLEAVALGTSVGVVSKTSLYSKIFDLSNISNDRPPDFNELTNNVPELIPSSINSFIASPALSLVSAGTVGSSTIYQYRFLQLNDRRVQTWYKWELTGTLLDQFFDDSTYYSVVRNGNSVEVFSVNLRQSSQDGFLTLPSGEKADVCLDYWTVNPYRTYSSANDTTTISLPYDHVTGKTFTVMALGGLIGDNNDVSSQSVGAVLYPTVTGSAGSFTVSIDGDYRGRDLIIGYLYNMEVELPKFYLTKSESGYASSDLDGDLVIHRINVAAGLGGPVKYEIDLTGIPTWENTVSVTQPNQYVLNNVNMAASSVHTVPIYQRNKNTAIKIIGDTPFPVTLLSLTWEGRYNTRFYKRM
jgi:hypothetical protein